MVNFIVTGKFRTGVEVENPKGFLWKPLTTEDSSSSDLGFIVFRLSRAVAEGIEMVDCCFDLLMLMF